MPTHTSVDIIELRQDHACTGLKFLEKAFGFSQEEDKKHCIIILTHQHGGRYAFYAVLKF